MDMHPISPYGGLGGRVRSKIIFSKSYKNASKPLVRGHKYSDMYLQGISKSFLTL